jgi:hypothetical protein
MIKKACGAAALVLTVGMAYGTTAAWADQPVVRGCVGSSISAAAQQPGPFGQFVADLAQDPESHPGISDNVRTLAAGGYSDDEFVNACN